METNAAATRHTCLKLEIPTAPSEPIFIKGTWFDSHFHLTITDGLNAWVCDGMPKSFSFSIYFHLNFWCLFFFSFKLAASEEQVKERASQWDQPVSEYIHSAEQYLGFQQPNSVYQFTDASDGHKRVSLFFNAFNCHDISVYNFNSWKLKSLILICSMIWTSANNSNFWLIGFIIRTYL